MLSARVTLAFLVVSVTGLLSTSYLSAEERRCNELGENCVCSEPLNGTLTRIGPSWYNPDDSETKECMVEIPGGKGAAIARNIDDLRPTNEASILGALPAGHKISTVIRAPEKHAGLWFLGHYFGDDQKFVKRLAVRWYRYYSPNYEMSSWDSSTCEQRGKITEAHVNFTSVGAGFTAYNFYNWTPNGRDCCNYVQSSYPTISQLKGKWWRIEYVMINRNGPGAQFTLVSEKCHWQYRRATRVRLFSVEFLVAAVHAAGASQGITRQPIHAGQVRGFCRCVAFHGGRVG